MTQTQLQTQVINTTGKHRIIQLEADEQPNKITIPNNLAHI
jgi:hypothetical protein